MTAVAHPLQWPDGWPRSTGFRKQARYKTGFRVALQHLNKELRLLGATHIVISSNVPLKQDGLPYAIDGGKHYDKPVTVKTIRARVESLVRDMPDDHIQEDGIWIDALRAIAEGTPDAQELAREALRTIQRGSEQEWERHYA